MAEHGPHCPFLNRADARCSAHFRLDHLGDAFEHCFDRYHGCAVYAELLLERRVRRAEAAALRDAPALQDAPPLGATGAWGPPPQGSRHAKAVAGAGSPGPAVLAHPLVQLTIAHRHAKRAAAGPHVPAVPRV